MPVGVGCLRKYVETARVLPTVTYNYQETANSLMRRYVNPHMIYNVINKSYEATQQLPLTQNFKNIIEDYYTDSLVMCGWSFIFNQTFRIKK